MIYNTYIYDPFNYILYIDKNYALIKSFNRRFNLTGNSLKDVLQNIKYFFKEPNSIDRFILKMKHKYSEETLKEILILLINKNVLINLNEYRDINLYDREFIEKNRYYTKNGKSLIEVKEVMNKIRIGLIGSSLIINNILWTFDRGGLFTNFNVLETDNANTIYKGYNNINVNVYHYESQKSIEALVSESDILLVATNYEDRYLFNLINSLCLENKTNWVRIVIDGETAEIGPLFKPGITCCYSCLYSREERNMNYKTKRFNNLIDYENIHKEQLENSLGLYGPFSLKILTVDILYNEIMNYIIGLDFNIEEVILRLSMDEYNIEKNKIFKDINCQICGYLVSYD